MDLFTNHYCSGISIFYTDIVGNCLVLLILTCFYANLRDNLQVRYYNLVTNYHSYWMFQLE